MQKIRLGRSELMVTKTSLGCLPLQRCSDEDAVRLIRAAYEGGINFFDTANAYTDSEKKLGLALSDVRENVVISTKSTARDKTTVLEHIENSLRINTIGFAMCRPVVGNYLSLNHKKGFDEVSDLQRDDN